MNFAGPQPQFELRLAHPFLIYLLRYTFVSLWVRSLQTSPIFFFFDIENNQNLFTAYLQILKILFHDFMHHFMGHFNFCFLDIR